MKWEITLLMLPGLIAGVTFHEFAHAWSASLLGDDFARRQGRVSLNPFRHLTPLGTIAILFLPIGWGKPVLVNLYNFRRPRRDYLLTSLAGPLANLVLAAACVGLMHWTRRCLEYSGTLGTTLLIAHQVLAVAVLLNAIMAVLNLLPIPPLDGSKIWPCILPNVKPAFTPKTNIVFLMLFLVLVFSGRLEPVTNYTLRIVAQWVPELTTPPFYDLCTAGSQAIRDKDWKRAEECYTDALRIDPQSAECYYARSIALLQQRKAKEALNDIDRAIAMRHDEQFALQRGYILRVLEAEKASAANARNQGPPAAPSAPPESPKDAPGRKKRSPDEVKQQRKQAAHRPRAIILNNDGNDSLTAPNDPPLTHEKFLDQRTTALAGTQVATLFYCTGVFNFYSHHSAETDPLRYTTGERHDQGWELGERGPDTLATIVDFGRRHGMEVFWSMRINDTHDSYTPHLLCPWKKEHPDWLLAKKGDKRIRSGNGRWSAVNYEVPEVREKVLRILSDVAERYDVEGLELDYFRHPIFFQPQIFGQPVTQAQRDLLTDMMRKVRKMADGRAAARGRPLLIAIRVPDSVDYCAGIGIDLPRWLEEDLVDLLVVGGYFQLNPWETSVALGHKYGVPVYPSLDDPRFKDEESLKLRQSDACYRARALEAWTAGGDGVYLFNFFDPHSPLLNELGDPKSLARMEQLYPSGAREETAAKQWLSGGEKFVNLPEPLPRHPVTLQPGKIATVELRAVRPQTDPSQSPPQVIARFCFKTQLDKAESVAMKLNGQALNPGTHDGRWINCSVQPELLQNGVNRFELTLAENAETNVVLQDLVLIVRPK